VRAGCNGLVDPGAGWESPPTDYIVDEPLLA